MKIGDLVINPYVPETFSDGSTINPMRKTMIIKISNPYVTTLRYDGKFCSYPVKDVKNWEVEKHIDILQLIK